MAYTTLGSLTTLGNKSKTTFLAAEPEKIAIEFEVAAGQTLYEGQPVKLTNDGKITAWAKADLQHKLLGYCWQPGTAGSLITVATRGYALIFALSSAAVNAGIGCYQSYDAATTVSGCKGYSKYAAAADVTETHALVLDQAGAADILIRVLLKN